MRARAKRPLLLYPQEMGRLAPAVLLWRGVYRQLDLCLLAMTTPTRSIGGTAWPPCRPCFPCADRCAAWAPETRSNRRRVLCNHLSPPLVSAAAWRLPGRFKARPPHHERIIRSKPNRESACDVCGSKQTAICPKAVPGIMPRRIVVSTKRNARHLGSGWLATRAHCAQLPVSSPTGTPRRQSDRPRARLLPATKLPDLWAARLSRSTAATLRIVPARAAPPAASTPACARHNTPSRAFRRSQLAHVSPSGKSPGSTQTGVPSLPNPPARADVVGVDWRLHVTPARHRPTSTAALRHDPRAARGLPLRQRRTKRRRQNPPRSVSSRSRQGTHDDRREASVGDTSPVESPGSSARRPSFRARDRLSSGMACAQSAGRTSWLIAQSHTQNRSRSGSFTAVANVTDNGWIRPSTAVAVDRPEADSLYASPPGPSTITEAGSHLFLSSHHGAVKAAENQRQKRTVANILKSSTSLSRRSSRPAAHKSALSR